MMYIYSSNGRIRAGWPHVSHPLPGFITANHHVHVETLQICSRSKLETVNKLRFFYLFFAKSTSINFSHGGLSKEFPILSSRVHHLAWQTSLRQSIKRHLLIYVPEKINGFQSSLVKTRVNSLNIKVDSWHRRSQSFESPQNSHIQR